MLFAFAISRDMAADNPCRSVIRADMIKHTLESRNTAVQGYLLYVLKTLTPEDAKRLTQETGLRFSTVKPEASVLGRRINIARAMQQAARGRASL